MASFSINEDDVSIGLQVLGKVDHLCNVPRTVAQRMVAVSLTHLIVPICVDPGSVTESQAGKSAHAT